MSAKRLKSKALETKRCDFAKQINDKTSIQTHSQIEVTHNMIFTQFPIIDSTQSNVTVRRTNHNEYNGAIEQFVAQTDDRININNMSSYQKTITSSTSSFESPHRLNRQRRNRHSFDSDQTAILEELFEQSTHYPDSLTIDRLSKQIQMPINKIQIWFQNRRAKFRRSCSATLNKNRF
jgi:hypothetical protein